MTKEEAIERAAKLSDEEREKLFSHYFMMSFSDGQERDMFEAILAGEEPNLPNVVDLIGMLPMTFEEFQKTGYDCYLPSVFPGSETTMFGRSYADDSCYIEKTDTGWHLHIFNEEYDDKNLAVLERILYDKFYVPEIAG